MTARAIPGRLLEEGVLMEVAWQPGWDRVTRILEPNGVPEGMQGIRVAEFAHNPVGMVIEPDTRYRVRVH